MNVLRIAGEDVDTMAQKCRESVGRISGAPSSSCVRSSQLDVFLERYGDDLPIADLVISKRDVV